MNDDNNGNHNFKRKKDRKNKDNSFKKRHNSFKKNHKTEDNTNSNVGKLKNNKKRNTAVKSIKEFILKISHKFDHFAGLDDKNQKNLKNNVDKNHEPKNKIEENQNIEIDENFINHFNNARDRYNKQKNNNNYNNFNSINKDFNNLKNNNNEFYNLKNNNKEFQNLKNNNKEFDKNKKQNQGNNRDTGNDKSPKRHFDKKRYNTDEVENSLVFLKNLKKINESSEENQGFFQDERKQFLSKEDSLIKNKENNEDFEINSDKIILDKKKLNIKDLFKLNKKDFHKIKNRIVSDEETKTLFGAAIFGLILIVLIFSSYYFIFYQPYQDELSNAKIAKLNELNSVYKGPLALDNEAFVLKSQIESAESPQEVLSIDIIRPATESWRYYHNREINIVKDDFNRVMATYTSNKTKNIITDVDNAHKIVADNDALVLANLEFKKPDTVAIPILITRLQAGAGLITVGSIVDIYTLNSYNNNNSQNSSNSGNDGGNNLNASESSSTQNKLNNGENNGTFTVFDEGPDISGVTVLAIMRSKDSGSIDANYIKTKINSNGLFINQIENSESFSTDVEEMLRGAIAGGFNEALITQLLDKYGLKLSDYERRSNLAELDVQYLLLIEVPRSDVSYTINNMDNLVLTIPTEHAPAWMVNELKSAYN